ncbi:uncharacterized protein LOC106653874 isoform X1 [Trichogramma pretiosum]|uniref:uncharacterized protein LOC106653874 isoform X1 n=1 Tax=Trichogramma pretiosum TaxID=7493 RepID=UPI0006C9C6D1|nr:uncharacterized protein LOC106653874 isoform X1 [Trichogramma pretiosum]
MVHSSYSPYISCGDDYLSQFSGHGSYGDNTELTSVLKVAASEYMRCLDGTETKWTVPYTYYKKAKGLANILNVDRTTDNLINYLLGFCLNQFAVTLDDFTEAVQTLESIDIDFVQKFPAVYAVLAELHCKLCRHDYALYYLNEGLSFLKKLDELNIFYLPETKIVLKDNGRDNKIWDYIKEKCSNFQMPDYVCVHSKCNNITKPYTTPSKQIYFKDPAFSDIIQVQCSHDPPCSLYFHKPCWFLEKEKHCLYHQTDEMIIDNHNVPCLNINCQSDPKPSVINSIGVMNAKGDIVFELKYPRSNTSKKIAEKLSKNHEAKDHSVLDVSKGAIKKDFTGLNTLKNSAGRKSDDLFKQEVEKFGVQDYNPFRINNRHSDRMNRVVVVKEGVEPKLKVTNRETEFLFSFFHEMISKNVGTTWVEVYDEYMKIQDNFLKKPTEDIRDFLLSTEAFEETPLDITSSDATVNETIESIMSTLAAHNERHKERSSANAYYDLLDDENHIVQSNQTSIKSPKDKTKNSCVETFNFPDSDEFKASDKDYLEKIINHSKSMEVELQEQIETNAHLGQMVRQQAAQIEHFETERQDLWDKIESLSKVISASTNLKKKYDQINQENLRLKQELLQMTLEVKKSKLNDLCQDQYPSKIDENKRKEILANFQEELKIIRDSLNNEWNQKYSALENSHKTLKETHKSLVSKYIDSRFAERKNLVYGIIQQSYDATAIISKINNWMKQKMRITNFISISMWNKRIELLNDTLNNDKKRYSTIKTELAAASEENVNNFTEIIFPLLPVSPPEHIANFVLGALDRFYSHQCLIVQNLVSAYQPQIPYPIPYQNYWYRQPFIRPAMQYPQRQQEISNYQQVPEQSQTSVDIIDVTYQRHSPKPLAESNWNSITNYETLTDKATNVIDDSEINHSVNIANTSVVNLSDSTSLKDSFITESVSNKSASEQLNTESAHKSVDTKSITEIVNTELVNEPVNTESVTKLVNNESVNTESGSDLVKSLEQLNIESVKVQTESKSMNESINELNESQLVTDVINTQMSKDTVTELKSTKSMTYLGKYELNNNSIKTQIETIRDDRSDTTNNTFRSAVSSLTTVKRKVGLEKLILIMRKKYSDIPKVDLIEVIAKIREKNNDSLSGLSINQIFREADDLLLRRHRLHMLQYDVLNSEERSDDINSNNVANISIPSEISFAVS